MERVHLAWAQSKLPACQQFAFERSCAEAEIKAHPLGRRPSEVYPRLECSGNRKLDGRQGCQLRGELSKDGGFDRANLQSQLERPARGRIAISRVKLRRPGAQRERPRQI